MEQSQSQLQRVPLDHKATLREIEDVLCEDIFPAVALEAPHAYEKGSEGSLSNAFGIHLAKYNKYEFCGITTWSVGEGRGLSSWTATFRYVGCAAGI